MAAYSAVVSFEQLLKQLLDSDQFPKSQLVPLHANVFSLQSSIETIFPAPKDQRKNASELEITIREAIYTALDTIEYSIIGKSLSSESEEIPGGQSSTSNSLEKIIANIDRVAKEAKDLAVSTGKDKKTHNSSSENVQSSKSTFSSRSTRIVGQDEDKKLLKTELTNTEDALQVVPISGMAGIGKTTLARSIYEDEDIQEHFYIRAWVTVSQDYTVGEILEKLLNSMESSGQKAGEKVSHGTDEQLRVQLHQNLFNNRYLVVIDDMWDQKVWDKVKNSLPDNKNHSRILLTTRIAEVAKSVKSSEFYHVMKPLGEEDSWTLLCEKTFGAVQCPPRLEKIGREIAKNCGGLPLSITVVGGLLSQERKTEKYWQTIQEDTNAAAAKGENSYLEILSLSYNNLPGNLKGCFLYMGAFPEDSEIPVSKLIKLWVAEGFLAPPSPPQPVEQVAEQSLEHLIGRNLILIRKNSSGGRIKTCGMHDSLRELAENESGKEKFFYSRKKYAQKQKKGTDTQRRVSVHKNILMCLGEVYNSTKSITNARTLLYVGPPYHRPLPFSLTFDLLRVLDALTVFFIEFPHEFLKLIHLRYLSFTYNGKLPKLLSTLQKLQTLIVHRQVKIIFVGASFLPEEIWNMPQLRHLLLTESDLPAPSGAKGPGQNSALLENLQSLSNFNAASCTDEVFQNMPSLKKLGMWIEAPGAIGLRLDKLNQLETFKFVVLRPLPGSTIGINPEHFFPKTLKKLNLSGCGLHWEVIEVIGKLPNLEVLKLRELAFQGEEWIPDEDVKFRALKFLLFEYLDLKCWGANHSNFPKLERLIIKHCYELEEMDPEIGDIGPLELIELVDCSPEAVEWAEEIKKKKKNNKDLQVRIYSSWK